MRRLGLPCLHVQDCKLHLQMCRLRPLVLQKQFQLAKTLAFGAQLSLCSEDAVIENTAIYLHPNYYKRMPPAPEIMLQSIVNFHRNYRVSDLILVIPAKQT